MLNETDKQWIEGALESALKIGLAAQRKWTEELVTEKVDELARLVAKGFEKCATKEELRGVEDRLKNVETRLGSVEIRLGSVEAHVGSIDLRLSHLERVVVTQDYLDERLGIVKEKELVVHKQLKMNTVTLVEELKRKKIVSPKRANTIVSMEPFPQKLP